MVWWYWPAMITGAIIFLSGLALVLYSAFVLHAKVAEGLMLTMVLGGGGAMLMGLAQGAKDREQAVMQ